MVWKKEYADCAADFKECEKLTNEYLNLLYKRGFEPTFYYDEFACGPTYGIKVNINGYDLTMYFDYLETDGECGADFEYYVEFPSSGCAEDFIDRLRKKYEDDLNDSPFGELYLYDEKEIAEIKASRKKDAEEDDEPYEEIDIEPCITLSCGYPKRARDVKQNVEEIIGAITEKGGVVEKIKKEIEKEISDK